jgi:LysR family hydrogen peroxide-inducible transcriptional activator
MNIQQFNYVLALAEERHFERAADKCYISQSTLSTMISRFEEELGIQVFDRRKKPLEITTEGVYIIEQLKKVNKEIDSLYEITQMLKGEVKGKLTIAVLPTIAPFLLPLFLHQFAVSFPRLVIEVRELTTAEILRLVKSRDLDIGIVSIPLKDPEIVEHHLYNEPFVYYDADRKNKKAITVRQLDLGNLCLLEEGHCMRNQILEFCDLFDQELHTKLNFRYKAGSIDSLLRFVKTNKASTLLPYLAAADFDKTEMKNVSAFAAPVPYRSVGLVVHPHFVKHNVLDLLRQEILKSVKPLLPHTPTLNEPLMPLPQKHAL